MLLSEHDEGRSRCGVFQCDSCGRKFQKRMKARFRKAIKHFCCLSCVNTGRVHTEEWKCAMSERNSGVNNPYYGKVHTVETRKLMSEKVSKGLAEMSSDEKLSWRNHISENQRGGNNPFYGQKHTDEARERMSKTRSRLISEGKLRGGPRGRSGTYTSTKTGRTERYDSFFELLRMRVLDIDSTVLSWTKAHGIVIQYELRGVTHRYVPDFKIICAENNVTLEEIKGYEDASKLEAKLTALKAHCLSNNMSVEYIDAQSIDEMARQWFGESLAVLRKKVQQ